MRPWSVLILSLGYGRDSLRTQLKSYVAALGFDARVYSEPGYPVDPSAFSHANCVEAIDQSDFVIAIIDCDEGGEFQTDEVPPAMAAELKANNIIPAISEALPPTILEVEVMVARWKKKTPFIFMPESVQGTLRDTIQSLRANTLILKERRHPVGSTAQQLITTAREPMCFSSQMTRGTPSWR